MPQTDTFPTYLRRLQVAQKIQGKHRVPYKYIAKELNVSECTIKRDVKWIRKQLDLPSIQKLVAEKVLKALDNCDTQEDKELILKAGLTFLGKAIPRTVEAHTVEEIREIKLLWEIKDELNIKDPVSAARRAAELSQQ